MRHRGMGARTTHLAECKANVHAAAINPKTEPQQRARGEQQLDGVFSARRHRHNLQQLAHVQVFGQLL